MKNKSVYDFDKIKDYFPSNNKTKETILLNQELIGTLKKVFNKWLINPNKENLKYIKERSILFIHKKGAEGETLNYRPISINRSLPRMFLKIINKKIQSTWKLITWKQFGFRKKFDTRIAVSKFLFELKRIKKQLKINPYIVMIDIAKCYDSVHHSLISESIKKFIQNNLIRDFLLKYYGGDGIGLYQGDPLSPILFAYISHFLISKLRKFVTYSQMFADDLILIISGNFKLVERKNQQI